MKRFVAKCFCLCLVTLLVAATSLQTNGQRGPKFVKYCSLFDPNYEGKTVSSIALMSYSTVGRVDGGDTFLYSADCNGTDYFAIPEGNSKVWGKWKNFFDKLEPEKNLTLEIKFEGTLEVETAHLFGSLDGWARAQIKLSKILSIKDVTSSPNAVVPDYKAAKPNIELIEGIRVYMQIFLQSLYAPRISRSDGWNFLADEFLFVDSNGKTYRRDQYVNLNATWAQSLTGLKETQTSYRLKSKTNDTMVYRATLKLVFISKPEEVFYCDVTFVLRNGEWTLRQATMVPGN